MKFLIVTITALTLMGCSILSGDEDIFIKDVPSVVKNTFSKEFPDAMDVEWEKKQKDYEADFEVGNVDYSALFNTAGSMLMYKQDIPVDSLPDAVSNKLLQDYKDYHIEDVEKIEKEGIVYYQVELESKIIERKEVLTADGQLADNMDYWD